MCYENYKNSNSGNRRQKEARMEKISRRLKRIAIEVFENFLA